MAKVMLTFLVVVLLVGYGFMFLSWNQQTVTVTGMSVAGQYWVEDNVPVGYVALGAVVVGALLMGLFLAGSHGGHRAARSGRPTAAHLEALAQVERAKVKLHELVAKIKAQRERIAELETELEAARAAAAPSRPSAEEPPEEEDEEFI